MPTMTSTPWSMSSSTVFFSYRGVALTNLLRWGVSEFNVDVEDDGMLAQYAQFFLMQRYRPCAQDGELLPLRFYAAKELSNAFETNTLATIHSRANPLSWFHGTAADDMKKKKKKGAIFCQY